jgi:hypothetical protein
MQQCSGKNDKIKPSSSTCQAFFSGAIKDKTTKESRKAAECLSSLRTISKNPSWKPLDSRTRMLKKSSASMQPCELARMKMQIGDTVPVSGMTRDLSQDISGNCGSGGTLNRNMSKSPMLVDVESEIQRRIHALGKSGKMFEDHAKYEQDQQMAADAEYLVRGIDPQVLCIFVASLLMTCAIFFIPLFFCHVTFRVYNYCLFLYTT